MVVYSEMLARFCVYSGPLPQVLEVNFAGLENCTAFNKTLNITSGHVHDMEKYPKERHFWLSGIH